MEGASILITDYNESVCFALLEFMTEKNVHPFVFVKEFEVVHDVYEYFPSAIPIVLDVHKDVESTIDHLSALPTMSCIFNFEGESFEELHRQTFDHFTRSITMSRKEFSFGRVNKDILEAISDGYTLIVNLVNFPLPPVHHFTLLEKVNQAESYPDDNSNQHLKYILGKMLARSEPPRPRCPAKNKGKEKGFASSRYSCQHIPPNRNANPLGILFRKILARFNPCSSTPILNFTFTRRRPQRNTIKSPAEINTYIRTEQSNEIRHAFEIIHEAALRNWVKACKEGFKFTPVHEENFRTLCEDIKRKGEEGRRLLLDKIFKDIERTKQWNHVLGEKTVDRLKLSREREVDTKVQQFCARKMAEAREKIDKDIRQCKLRAHGVFYREILDEQVMELLRIKEIYKKRAELLMLPYTGELKILVK